MQEEVWKDIPHSPGYMISSHGRVKSVGRIVNTGNGPRRIKTRTLATKTHSFGYQYACYRINGKMKHVAVHRLMAEAFLPDWAPWKQVNHVDSNPSNNSLENLECVSCRQNVAHAKSAKRLRHGERSPLSIVSQNTATEIKSLLENTNFSYLKIAHLTRSTKSIVEGINTGNSWADSRSYPIREWNPRPGNPWGASGIRGYDASTKAYVVAMVKHTQNANQICRMFQISSNTIERWCRFS